MTENEVKFILNRDIEDKFLKLGNKATIWQGYLFSSKGISLRCRKIQAKKINYYLTLKSSVNGRVIEIESIIDERDFNDLWSQCMNRLEKTRYFVYDKREKLWEVDFFKDHNEVNYFCVAEHEMPEGQTKPEFIPSFIKDNLIYEVPLTDCRFSSKLLADVRHSNKLYQELKKCTK